MKSWGERRSLIFAFILFLVVGLVIVFSPKHMVAQGEVGDAETILQKRLGEAVVLYTGSPLALVKNMESQIDNENTEICPFTREGRVLVPLRFLAENLEAQVKWEEQTGVVTLNIGAKTVKFIPGQEKMQVNGREVTIECPPEIVEGRTFVPVRAISEALGKKVFYDRGLIVLGEKEKPFNQDTEKSLLDTLIAKVNNLPTVGSLEQLRSLLADTNQNNYYRRGAEVSIAGDLAKSVQNVGKMKEESMADDYSETNVQVAGVDEADLVKTDGEYLYQVNKGRVLILKAYPSAEMQVVSTLTFAEENYQPLEIYVDDQYLVVIGSSRNYYGYGDDYTDAPVAKMRAEIWPPRYTQNRVKALIYDLQDKSKLTKIREVEIDGCYLSSRKIGSYLYLVANDPLDYYHILEKPSAGNAEAEGTEHLVPTYRDTVVQEDFIPVPYQDIRYIPPVTEANYLVIAGLDLAQKDQAVQVSTYLGAGDNLYVSPDNLYVALRKHEYRPLREEANLKRIMTLPAKDNTLVYKFSLEQGKVTYLAKGEVPGTLLNQFSMDENQQYLRIATTKGNTWGSGENLSQNNVYVLDESMSMVGKIENIAPGERIYSARFIGDRAYLVTFKDTDPFFVLDLKQPASPRILGALKIPGYSDYLHPYDENHIIGIGKDTIELSNKDARGNVLGSQAYYQGMKLALFDVRDVHNPRELFKEVIGARGTDSELLRNHKALLFDKEKELLAFPVTVMEIQGEKIGNNFPAYGQFAFQGAYIYQLNLTDGFKLRGKITHLTAEDALKAGLHSYKPDSEIKRLLYIKDTLYTLSEGMVKAHGLVDLVERKAVQLR
ncbi:MAG: beta-propeller domain-containing protein [Clostridia bacterium]|nr:beta-propeller domain-containing protein [Clostridia bacterium]MDD4145521.1 beta-propeller domain-containing protein [Clostridia bacterium]MDD4665018.1 beta-propeller domain-containing protein [Clostridia bacterium]